MKFFNWMLRKSHQSTDYSLVSYDKDALRVESGAKTVERDTEILLNHMLDGFLTIGTLGHSNPLLLSPIQEEDPKGAAEVAAELDVEAQAKPEVEAQAESKALPVEKIVLEPARKQPVQISAQPNEVETSKMSPLEEHKRPSCEIIEPLLINGADTGPRTTLADLFAVDAEVISSGNDLVKKNQSSIEEKTGKKVVLKGDYSAPPRLPAITNNVHRLMAKMLKKKIHPDLGQVKSRATDGEEQGRFSPKVIRATVSCSCYGTTGHFPRVKRDPHGGKVVGTAI